MISAALASSARRTAAMSSRTSSRSIAGLRMSPASPPVQHTRTVRTPSALYLATVPGPFDDSSSGWACTVSRHRGAVSIRVTIPTPPAGRSELERGAIPGQPAATAVPDAHGHPGQQAAHDPEGQGDPEEPGAHERAVEPGAGLGGRHDEQRDRHDREGDGDAGHGD